MKQDVKAEVLDAIENGRICKIDQGKCPGGHSEPFFYKTHGDDDLIILRAKEKRFTAGFRKQQILYPFLLTRDLPVRTARELEILECNDKTYAVMERFFGNGHSPERFSKATDEQRSRIVRQIAFFFLKLHSIPPDTLPTGVDYTPYFKYEKGDAKNDDVFLHADFNYSNFLVDDDYNLHAVFDWHPACVDPRIAEFAAFVYCNDLEFLHLVLREYNKLAGTSILPEQVILHNSGRNEQ